MESFQELFNQAQRDPAAVERLLLEAAGAGPTYPGHYAAIYLLGMLAGACACALESPRVFLERLKMTHGDFLEMKPRDFIGAKRIWARGSGM